MIIKVLLFGVLAEKAGKEELKIENILSLDELNKHINDKYPSFKNIQFRFSVNRILISGNKKLKEGDEVAMLPPFAGG